MKTTENLRPGVTDEHVAEFWRKVDAEAARIDPMTCEWMGEHAYSGRDGMLHRAGLIDLGAVNRTISHQLFVRGGPDAMWIMADIALPKGADKRLRERIFA